MNDPVFSSTQDMQPQHCMGDVFSNKRIEKSYDTVFLGMISKTKTARHTSELRLGKKRKKTKKARQTTN